MMSAGQIAAQTRSFDLEAGDAKTTLREFARQARLDVVMDRRDVQGVQTNEVSGLLEPRIALERMLEGTLLVFKEDLESGAFAVTRSEIPSPDGTTQNTEPQILDEIEMNTNNKYRIVKFLSGLMAALLTTPANSIAQDESEDEGIFDLSPFVIEASEDEGYRATTTLAGTRIRSDVRDLGASIAIITSEFLEDTGATDGESLLAFVGNVEVGGVLGNFANTTSSSTAGTRANPQRAQRVRGLDSAALTRDYFSTDIPFDRYNTSRVTINRGPNSILFGLGSPGGIINNSTGKAQIGSDFGRISFRVDHKGGHRETLSINKTLIKDRLAIRIALLNENLQFRQEPAFEDDTRFFVAWDLVLLKNEGSNIFGKTTFRGSFEQGEIYRNPPDVVPPQDGYSGWWEGLGSQEDVNRILSVPGVDFTDIRNDSLTSQQVIAAINAGIESVPDTWEGTLEEYAAVEGQFVPNTLVDRFKSVDRTDPTRGGTRTTPGGSPGYWLYPAINFNSITSTTPGWDDPDLAGIQGIMSRFRPAYGRHDIRWGSTPTGGAGFSAASIDDREVFDYHKNLLLGTTNKIITDFDISQFVLEQELFGGNAGFEIAWDEQHRERYDETPFDGGRGKTIRIDVTRHHGPGDRDYDGTADYLFNENLGRPAVLSDITKTRSTNDQETFRATIFGTIDFKDMIDGKMGKILGRHSITGLFENRERNSWSRSTKGAWWADNSKAPASGDISGQLSHSRARSIHSQVYLGDSAIGLSRPEDLRIDGYIDGIPFPEVGDEYGIWYFDNNRNVDDDVQATWRVIEAISGGGRGRNELESKAISLQSHFLNDHIIASWATRNDVYTVWQRIQSNIGFQTPGTMITVDGELVPAVPARLDFPGFDERDGNFNEALLFLEDDPATIDESDTDTWGVVVRFPEFLTGDLPYGIDISGHYYEAESWQPAGVSNNILNQPIPSPTGVTEEYGVTIEFNDGAWAVRFNKFETTAAFSRTNLGGQLGNITGRFAFYLDRVNSAENTGLALFPDGWHEDPAQRTGDALLTPDTIPDNRERTSGTDADLGGFKSYEEYNAALIDAVLPELQAIRNYRVYTLENGDRANESDPILGLNSTRDRVATGTEVDIIGRLTSNLSISMNVAQQKTVNTNIGPIAIDLAFKQAERLQRPLPNSPGGWSLWDLRDAPHQVVAINVADRYESILRAMRIQQGLDGTVSSEQREWRINTTLRYDFREGFLKGLQVGGSLRFQDQLSGGYPNRLDEFGNVLPEIANPWFGPREWNGDLFLRYNRKIFDNQVDWRVQLNARNLYRSRGAKDIPVTINPDGSTAIIRIPNEQQFFLTNTFSF